MMRIIVLLKFLVKVQYKLLIMACWLFADMFQYDHYSHIYSNTIGLYEGCL